MKIDKKCKCRATSGSHTESLLICALQCLGQAWGLKGRRKRGLVEQVAVRTRMVRRKRRLSLINICIAAAGSSSDKYIGASGAQIIESY